MTASATVESIRKRRPRTTFAAWIRWIQQVDFWTAAVPVELWTLSSKLAEVDQFLDDPAMLAPLAAV